eukprot:672583-Pyramimonas_sp.AAC.1
MDDDEESEVEGSQHGGQHHIEAACVRTRHAIFVSPIVTTLSTKNENDANSYTWLHACFSEMACNIR